jgi:hydroxymethylbilane synthase
LGSLVETGGKGLFVKELEQALFDKRADIAVHSMKDMPMEYPSGLDIIAICERADPRDVLVSNKYLQWKELPEKSIVGTSSLRRSCQLHVRRQDLNFKLLRGNVDTRVHLLDENHYDAIVLAAAGLLRLGLQDRITEYLATDICLPAAGQGAIGIECRVDDVKVRELILKLDHPATHVCVQAERALVRELQGSCQVPIAAYAVLQGDHLHLQGRVGKPDGSVLLEAAGTGKIDEAEALGKQLGQDLLAKGAEVILKSL